MSSCSFADMRASSWATWPVLRAAVVVWFADCATPVMFWAMSVDPSAASETLRDISSMVAVCFSTAEAIVVRASLMRAMISELSPIASTAAPVSV